MTMSVDEGIPGDRFMDRLLGGFFAIFPLVGVLYESINLVRFGLKWEPNGIYLVTYLMASIAFLSVAQSTGRSMFAARLWFVATSLWIAIFLSPLVSVRMVITLLIIFAVTIVYTSVRHRLFKAS
jgi:hypothetical protein